MTKTVQAIFDGEVLRLKEPLELEPNTVVQVTIMTVEPGQTQPLSFLDTALSLKLEGPPDWSERLE
jgi:AF2212-like